MRKTSWTKKRAKCWLLGKWKLLKFLFCKDWGGKKKREVKFRCICSAQKESLSKRERKKKSLFAERTSQLCLRHACQKTKKEGKRKRRKSGKNLLQGVAATESRGTVTLWSCSVWFRLKLWCLLWLGLMSISRQQWKNWGNVSNSRRRGSQRRRQWWRMKDVEVEVLPALRSRLRFLFDCNQNSMLCSSVQWGSNAGLMLIKKERNRSAIWRIRGVGNWWDERWKEEKKLVVVKDSPGVPDFEFEQKEFDQQAEGADHQQPHWFALIPWTCAGMEVFCLELDWLFFLSFFLLLFLF